MTSLLIVYLLVCMLQVYWIHKDTQTTISEDDKIMVDATHNTIVNGYPKFQVSA